MDINIGRGIRQLASGTIVSRVLGLARDVALANFFGTGGALAGFLLAFTVPNLMRKLLGEGALAEAAVPSFVERDHNAGRKAAFALANRLLVIATILLVACSAAALLVGPFAAMAADASWVPEVVKTFLAKDGTRIAITLLPLIMPYCIFICLGGFIGGILYALDHFKVPAYAPALLNVAYLAGIGWATLSNAGEDRGIVILVWAVLIAGILQLLAVTAVLWKFGWRPSLGCGDGVRKVLRQMSMLIFGSSLAQINVSIDRILAVWLGEQAVTGLYFAERLIYLPVGVVGVAVASAALPKLTRESTIGDSKAAAATLGYCLRITALLTIPASILLIVLCEPTIQILFERGKFDADSVSNTAMAVVAYAPGILFFAVAKPVRAAFIGRSDVRTPVIVSAGCLIVNVFLNLILMQHLEHAGLALATVVSSALNLGILLWLLSRADAAYLAPIRQIFIVLLRLIPAQIGAAAVAYGILQLMPEGNLGNWGGLILGGGLGGLTYLALARIFVPDTLAELTALIRRAPVPASRPQ